MIFFFIIHSSRIAHFQFHEALQPGVMDCLKALRAQGIDVGILSGDREGAVTVAAALVGIPGERCVWGCSPEDKAQHIAVLEGQGLRVAFVGDGINDAPALAAATLGLSVHEAGTASRGASALTLGPSGLRSLPEILPLLANARRRAQLSLGWAALYNVLAMSAAVLGWMSPAWAALAMIASSLSVTISALRPLLANDARRMPESPLPAARLNPS